MVKLRRTAVLGLALAGLVGATATVVQAVTGPDEPPAPAQETAKVPPPAVPGGEYQPAPPTPDRITGYTGTDMGTAHMPGPAPK